MTTKKKKEVKKAKLGRPRLYDPSILAEELLEWSKQDYAINFVSFCAERGYLPELIWRLDKQFPEFSQAYTIAKMRLAARREVLANAEMINYGSYMRYQDCYDPFLRKDEDEKKDQDAKRKQGIANTEQANLVLLAKLAAKGEISQKD